MLNCVTLFVNSKDNKEQQEAASKVGYFLDIAISIADNKFKLKSLYSREPLKTASLPTCSVRKQLSYPLTRTANQFWTAPLLIR